MSTPLLALALAAFLFPAVARGSCYEPLCCTNPPVTGATHIESVSPQVALPGVTVVYIQGYCFGDPPAGGIIPPGASITLNGEVMTDIVFWTDAEIGFIPPDDATSGNLVVTSPSYGSDSTTNEANCVSSSNENLNIEPDYCGNDKINATFSIVPVGLPVYWNAPLGTGWAPEYVQGTWNYNDGGETMTLTLKQGSLNATNGTWQITGEEVDNLWGQYNNVSGTLDEFGDLALCLAFGNQSPNAVEWLVLGSGDVTSQGLQHAGACAPGSPPVATKSFIEKDMDSAEGSYYQLAVPPLFKSATDKPPGETVTALTPWLTLKGSTLPTGKAWERTFLPLNSLGLVDYAGRFVYEQSDGTGASDGCWYSGSQQPKKTTTTLSGGGWYVDPQSKWGPDTIGMNSAWVSYYQDYYGPKGESCVINTPQDLYIDTRTGPVWVPWVTDTQMPAEITPKDLFVGLVPGQGELVTACEPFPSTSKGKCK